MDPVHNSDKENKIGMIKSEKGGRSEIEKSSVKYFIIGET